MTWTGSAPRSAARSLTCWKPSRWPTPHPRSVMLLRAAGKTSTGRVTGPGCGGAAGRARCRRTEPRARSARAPGSARDAWAGACWPSRRTAHRATSGGRRNTTSRVHAGAAAGPGWSTPTGCARRASRRSSRPTPPGTSAPRWSCGRSSWRSSCPRCGCRTGRRSAVTGRVRTAGSTRRRGLARKFPPRYSTTRGSARRC
jgi:hypothetical protein